MKEQLPLKRIIIGLATSIVTSLMVTVVGSADEIAFNGAGNESYVVTSDAEACRPGAYASVRALNHEEYKEIIQNLNLPQAESVTDKFDVQDEYDVTEWWKAELSDYNETLEQQALVPIETPAPAEIAPPANADPVNLTPEPTGALSVPASQPVNLPDNLESNTFYFTSYGYGHGVGLSQNGANLYATYAGYDYLQILQHYYPGTTVMYTPDAESETISVRGYSGGVVDILSMVCNAEVGSSFNVEAIKAQAIAAYTYIKYSGGSTNGMAIKEGPNQKIIDAVKSVVGQAVYYNGSFALTQFYASSGGSTASCKDVFYQDIPYLRSVPCELDAAYDSHYGEITKTSVDALRTKLQSTYGITLSADYSSWIQLVEGDGGYIADVIIDNQKTVDGYAFARSLGIRSGKFTVLYT